MTIAPIYRDTIYEYTGDTLTYRITLEGETIFEGKAYSAPDEDTISININRICENYLSNNDIDELLDYSESELTATTAYREFLLLDDSGNTLETYRFLYDYDYEGGFDETGGLELSDPVSYKYDSRMLLFYTYWDGDIVTNSTSNPYYAAHNQLVCGAEYALYYLNALGGWDSFVIEGYSVRTDKIDRHQYNKTYNNQTIEYEKNTYISEITSSWKLNTGLLNDRQAHNLCWNLLSSNRVYLHDLSSDKIIPVVITNTQNIYNTYRNNNHQPIQYEIAITESQTKLRR